MARLDRGEDAILLLRLEVLEGFPVLGATRLLDAGETCPPQLLVPGNVRLAEAVGLVAVQHLVDQADDADAVGERTVRLRQDARRERLDEIPFLLGEETAHVARVHAVPDDPPGPIVPVASRGTSNPSYGPLIGRAAAPYAR